MRGYIIPTYTTVAEKTEILHTFAEICKALQLPIRLIEETGNRVESRHSLYQQTASCILYVRDVHILLKCYIKIETENL